MQKIPRSASEHYREQQRVTSTVLLAAGAVIGDTPPADPDRWWRERGSAIVDLAKGGQARVVRSSSRYVEQSLIETTGSDIRPDVSVDPSGLVGVASDGRPLESLLSGPVESYRKVVESSGLGTDTAEELILRKDAWRRARADLELRLLTQIADAERVATGLEVAARKGVGYTRLARVGACSRCVVLAGRWYRWSDGFLRHPKCMCRHIPTTKKQSEQIRLDAREYFDALSEREQAKIFTRAGAEAIRSGADINQVVNARRGLASGLDTAGGRASRRDVYGRQLVTTTEGTTKRGFAGKLIRERGRDPKTTPRLMPEDIYEIATDREDALRLLELNGYAFDNTKPGNRGSLVNAGEPDRPEVDLDAVERARLERERAEQLRLYLDAEAKWRADVEKYLAAEKDFLEAERRRKADLILTDETRDLLASARASLPVDRDGWRKTVSSYPTDPAGRLLVPKELQKHLRTTLDAGRAIRADASRRFTEDPALTKLVAEEKDLAVSNPLSVRRFDTIRAINTRQREILQQALAEVRGFGGAEQAIASTTKGGANLGPATRETVETLRRAEAVFPTDWLAAASARGELELSVTDRAYFHSRAGLGGRDVLAGSRPKPATVAYRGAFTDYDEEVMAHEIGHRMEQAIPGLTHLEFALVRTRSTRNGALEPLTKVYPNDPELADEVGYEDDWENRYAGKSYERDNPDNPASTPAEAFQVGLQDTFGRSHTGGQFDTTGELQDFVMGVLALL